MSFCVREKPHKSWAQTMAADAALVSKLFLFHIWWRTIGQSNSTSCFFTMGMPWYPTILPGSRGLISPRSSTFVIRVAYAAPKLSTWYSLWLQNQKNVMVNGMFWLILNYYVTATARVLVMCTIHCWPSWLTVCWSLCIIGTLNMSLLVNTTNQTQAAVVWVSVLAQNGCHTLQVGATPWWWKAWLILTNHDFNLLYLNKSRLLTPLIKLYLQYSRDVKTLFSSSVVDFSFQLPGISL